MGTLLCLTAVSLGLRWRVNQPHTSNAWFHAASLTSLGLYFCIGRVLGPLVLLIAPLTIHTVLNSLSGHRGHGRFVLVSTCVLRFGMVALEHLGVLTPSYQFTDGAMIITPNLVELPPTLTCGLLLGLSVLSIALPSLSIGRLPQEIHDAERAQALRMWHLRQLLPGSQVAKER